MAKEIFMFQGKKFIFTGSYFDNLPIYAYKAKRIVLEDDKVWRVYDLVERPPAQG